MLLEVLNNNVPAKFLINCHLLREGFCASQIISITNFVIVLSVSILRADCIFSWRSKKKNICLDTSFIDSSNNHKIILPKVFRHLKS